MNAARASIAWFAFAQALLGCTLDLDALRAKQAGQPAQAVQGISSAHADAAVRDQKDAIDWAETDPATGWYPTDSVAKPRPSHGASCGEVGQSCCMPGNTCSEGACLRGHCTPYGGFYAEQSGCGSNPCSVRDPYTAGCACPAGFAATPVLHSASSCGVDAGSGELELVACTADGSETTAFGGAWLARAGASCSDECIYPNASDQRCACPPGAGVLRLELAAQDGMCAGSDASLSICIDATGTALGFGGAFITTSDTKPRCVVPNPVTNDCTCQGTVSAQLFALGEMKLGVCNL